MKNLFEEVQKLLIEGKSRVEIASILDCQKSVVNYYANPKNREKFLKNERTKKKRLNFEEAVLKVIDHATSLSNICDLIGIRHTNVNIQRISNFLKEKNISPKWKKIQLNRKPKGYWTKDNIFTENSLFPGSKLKDKLINLGLKEGKCEICGKAEWLNHPIPLQVHHINGINNDNRLGNLQILCPNCHALTDNYCGKNINFIQSSGSKTTSNKKSYKDIFSKEFLESELNNKDFTNFDDLSKKLKIGRKTLQKLCREYGLPGSKTEMGLISREVLKDVKCQYCGKIFKPSQKNSKFCSINCFRKANGQPEFGVSISREEILKKSLTHSTMSSLAKEFGYKDLRKQCIKNKLPTSIKKLKEIALK